MQKCFLGLLALLCLISRLSAQNITNWKTYTNKKEIKDFVLSDNKIWAAASGGGFTFNSADSSYRTYNKSEGLKGFPLTSIAIDSYGKAWFGSSTGIIDIVDTAGNTVKSIYDIKNSDKDYKTINEMRVYGDTITVALDFGVSLIDSKSLIFIDTYFRFGDLPSNIKVKSVVKNNVLFVATASGIAVQKSPNINLSLPDSWKIFNPQNGLNADSIRQLAVFKGDVIAATSNGIFVYKNNSFIPLSSLTSARDVKLVTANGDSLFFVSNNTIKLFYNETVTDMGTYSGIVKLGINSRFGLAVGTASGIYMLGNFYYPDGPYSNQFLSLSVDNKSALWIASGKDITGKGFYKYDGKKWTNYYSGNYSLPTDAYFNIWSDNNAVFAGSWGKGFVKVQNDKLSVFTTDNTPMKGVQGAADYLVIGGFNTDSKGNLWILNYGSADYNNLYMLTEDSLWHGFQIPAEGYTFRYGHTNLVIDQNDTKWYAIQDNSKPGLFYFNEKGTLSNSSDDVSGFLNSSNGLNTDVVNAVVTDQMGDIWVGTSLGVNVISNTYSALYSNPQFRTSSVFSLRQQTVNCIAVDPINQKWVGTNQGLILVNSDGSSLITVLNSSNSPLMDDAIRSIAIDANKGIVYVGTDNGLVSFNTPFIKPVESFTSLFVYPNPFILNKNNKITIDGLIKDSDIKILTASGTLVNQFSSPGGKVAYWDGKDLSGKLVGSGIYLIVAYDKEGNNVVTGKVAVLKK
jgi:ligand-binding sensor domain-containing protein